MLSAALPNLRQFHPLHPRDTNSNQGQTNFGYATNLNGASSGMSWVRDGSVNALNTAFTNNCVWFGSVGRDSSSHLSYYSLHEKNSSVGCCRDAGFGVCHAKDAGIPEAKSAASGPQHPIVGAIRWDAWTGGRVTSEVERSLGQHAWNEHDEGGWISPIWTPSGKPDTGRLDAISRVLKSQTGEPLTSAKN